MSDDFQYDVFLSHSTKDKSVVRDLSEKLKKDGVRVWFDEWVIKPGDNIPAKIEEGLDQSRVLVLCMSTNAFSSDWAQLEAGTFRFRDPLNKNRRFLPLRLDNVPIKSALAQFLYISWLPTDREQAYPRLLEACRSPTPLQRDADISSDKMTSPLHDLPPSARWAKTCVLDGIEAIERSYARKGEPAGISTGFSDFDSLTDGLQPGQMFVIAGGPSMGKTAFAMNIVEHVAVDAKIPSAIFSFEMTSRQLSQRILCSRARVSLMRVQDGFLSERDFPSLVNAAAQIAESPLLIDDATGLTLQELGQRLRFYVKAHGIGLAVIDNLQLLRSGSRRPRDSRQVEISAISAGLKTLATELNIPIIVIVRLEGNRRPRLSDLRSIELDADVVIFVIRETFYAESEEEREEMGGRTSVIVAKHRNGRVGSVRLTFLREYARFE